MKCLNLVLFLLLSVGLTYGQSSDDDNDNSMTVTTTVKKTSGGGYSVHSIAESDTEKDAAGDPKRGGSMEHADSEEDLAATVASASSAAVKRLVSMTSNVKAGPDGKGDLVLGGTMPSGDFPPIIITIGEGDTGQRTPKGTTMLKYKNMAHFNSNLRRDVSKAISRMEGLR